MHINFNKKPFELIMTSVVGSHCDPTSPEALSILAGRYRELACAVFGDSARFVSELPVSSVSDLKTAATVPIMEMGANWSTKDVSQAASLFLFRKCLPSPKVKDPFGPYLKKLSRPSITDAGFAAIAQEVVPKLFPLGWDRDWAKIVNGTVVSPGACTEVSRKAGGTREYIRSKYGVDGFVKRLLTGKGIPMISPEREVCVIPDGGKDRLITIASGDQAFLAPLHALIYNHLTASGFVLRGDANASTMSGLCRERGEEGEVFISGDYEAATDLFEVSHSRLLLDLIERQSSYVPDALFFVAKRSLTGVVRVDGDIHPQDNGQMMGNYLSFPLLCLTNVMTVFLGLGYSRTMDLSEAGRLKINGDDIVFRCSREEGELWESAVAKCGLKLSKGKTLVHKRFWSLNSTFFRADFGKVSMIPVIRSKSILTPSNIGFKSLDAVILSGLKGFSGRALTNGTAFILRRFSGVLGGRAGKPGAWRSLTTGRHWKSKVTWETLGKANRHLLKREYTILDPLYIGMDLLKGDPSGYERKPNEEKSEGGLVPQSAVSELGLRTLGGFSSKHIQKACSAIVGQKFRDWTWGVACRESLQVGGLSTTVGYVREVRPVPVKVDAKWFGGNYRREAITLPTREGTQPLALVYEQLIRQEGGRNERIGREVRKLGVVRSGLRGCKSEEKHLAPAWLAAGLENMKVRTAKTEIVDGKLVTKSITINERLEAYDRNNTDNPYLIGSDSLWGDSMSPTWQRKILNDELTWSRRSKGRLNESLDLMKAGLGYRSNEGLGSSGDPRGRLLESLGLMKGGLVYRQDG